MFRRAFSLFILLVCCINSEGQTSPEKPKIFNHYIGVQANQLFRQILNLNNNNTPISNPYLLTYSIQSVKCGWGLQTGFGYEYRRTADELSPANHESKINNFFYRVGLERKFILSKRFEAGCALDYTGDYQVDRTFTTSVVNNGNENDSSVSVSVTKKISSGGGLQLSLGYRITEHLSLNTETTLYFLKSKQKENVTVNQTVTNNFNPDLSTETLNSTNLSKNESNFTITAPVVIFLVLKF